VARAFDTSRSNLARWNALDTSARLQTGMVLQIYVPESAALEAVRHIEEREARVLVSGSPEFFDYFEGMKGKRRVVIAAREGDSLKTLGKRYGMSVGWMERVNRRSRRDEVKAGDPIVIYVPREQPVVDKVLSGTSSEVEVTTTTSPTTAESNPKPQP